MGFVRPGNMLFCAVVLCCLCTAGLGADDVLPAEPPGPYFKLSPADHSGAESFKAGEPLVGASYFYWYDIESKAHIVDGDGTDALTTHPADMNDISYRRSSWHKAQLREMIDAGLDFLMPVFWGVPGKYDGWSFVGLRPLVEAHNELEAEGAEPPKIGLFYDTSILRHNGFRRAGAGNYHVELSTQFGKAWFYTAMRDFFSLIPPEKWARIDGRPIVFLYAAAFAKDQDEQGQFAYVKRSFAEDFGIESFIVKGQGWKGRADAAYAWGGAVSGPLIYRQTIALGPGYDHSAVPGRAPLVVDRRDGATYIERWRKVLQLDPAHRPWLVHVETWNEWHEGTDVAASREYGRLYIELTRLFSDMWHQKLLLGGTSPYGGRGEVTWGPGRARGLSIRASGGDGIWRQMQLGQVRAVVSAPNPHSPGRYLYFNVDDAFAFGLFEKTAVVYVTYHDAGCSSFRLDYDSSNPQEGPFEGSFRPSRAVEVAGSGEWKTARFVLAQCRFMNRCNGADLRIAVVGAPMELAVSAVRLEAASRR